MTYKEFEKQQNLFIQYNRVHIPLLVIDALGGRQSYVYIRMYVHLHRGEFGKPGAYAGLCAWFKTIEMLEETVPDFVLSANNVFTIVRTHAIASYIAAVSLCTTIKGVKSHNLINHYELQ